VGHTGDPHQRQHRRSNEALVERTHDVLAGTKAREERAKDRRHDANSADCQRIDHHFVQHRVAGQEDRNQDHGRNDGHGIGLEQICGHTGAIADIVADIVSDHGRVAGVILGDTRFNLTNKVRTDIGALGEDTTAQTRKDRNQRRTEAKGYKRIDEVTTSGISVLLHPDHEAEVTGHREKCETSHQHAGYGTGPERDRKAFGHAAPRRLGRTHIGTN